MNKLNYKTKILIVDDEFSVRDSLSKWFMQDGYYVQTAEDAEKALKLLSTDKWDIILLDIKLPGMNGLELQAKIKDILPSTPTIMITAYASIESAVTALKNGAYDYITKPIDPEHLSHILSNVLSHTTLKRNNIQLKNIINEINTTNKLLGESEDIRKIKELAQTVATTDTTVMIRGESGTGKEIIAQMIHSNSSRKYAPFITVHCGAIPETLLESELFGHEKGAYTGAQYKRKGKFEMANGGTIFLDEIGTISLKMQIELLRVIETKTFTRIGGNTPIQSDFRIICATNSNLEEAIEKGEMRSDLYYRLNVFTINTTPLRDHKEDIPILTEYFIEKHALNMSKKIKKISPKAIEKLMNYHWPGNVRELENIIERAMVLNKSDIITDNNILVQIKYDNNFIQDESLSSIECQHIKSLLEKYQWNITHTAQALGIDRVTLYNKINKYHIKKS